jgi:hypothetical protein
MKREEALMMIQNHSVMFNNDLRTGGGWAEPTCYKI